MCMNLLSRKLCPQSVHKELDQVVLNLETHKCYHPESKHAPLAPIHPNMINMFVMSPEKSLKEIFEAHKEKWTVSNSNHPVQISFATIAILTRKGDDSLINLHKLTSSLLSTSLIMLLCCNDLWKLSLNTISNILTHHIQL